MCVLVRAKQSALSLSRCNDPDNVKLDEGGNRLSHESHHVAKNNDPRKYFYLFSFFIFLSPSSFLGYRSTLGREMEATTAAFEF